VEDQQEVKRAPKRKPLKTRKMRLVVHPTTEEMENFKDPFGPSAVRKFRKQIVPHVPKGWYVIKSVYQRKTAPGEWFVEFLIANMGREKWDERYKEAGDILKSSYEKYDHKARSAEIFSGYNTRDALLDALGKKEAIKFLEDRLEAEKLHWPYFKSWDDPNGREKDELLNQAYYISWLRLLKDKLVEYETPAEHRARQRERDKDKARHANELRETIGDEAYARLEKSHLRWRYL
jgi:hypothetical protein